MCCKRCYTNASDSVSAVGQKGGRSSAGAGDASKDFVVMESPPRGSLIAQDALKDTKEARLAQKDAFLSIAIHGPVQPLPHCEPHSSSDVARQIGRERTTSQADTKPDKMCALMCYLACCSLQDLQRQSTITHRLLCSRFSSTFCRTCLAWTQLLSSVAFHSTRHSQDVFAW